jgi:hypothetical protein
VYWDPVRVADSLPRVCLDLVEVSREVEVVAEAAACCSRRVLPLVFMMGEVLQFRMKNGVTAGVGSDGVTTVALETAIAVQFYMPLGLKRP